MGAATKLSIWLASTCFANKLFTKKRISNVGLSKLDSQDTA
jgi:hypothetical protein